MPEEEKNDNSQSETEEEEPEVIEEIKKVKPETQKAGFVWTPEIIKGLGEFALEFLGKDLADKFLSYKKNEAEARRRYFETVSKHNRYMIYVLILFLSAIVAFMSYLTVSGSVSGDALLFLVGTITGYLLLFIQRLVFPSRETPVEEEEA